MTWLNMIGVTLLVVGAAGFCLMMAAFVVIARQGWKQAIQQPIVEGRWTPARRLMLVGAALAATFAIGIAILASVPGGIPWFN